MRYVGIWYLFQEILTTSEGSKISLSCSSLIMKCSSGKSKGNILSAFYLVVYAICRRREFKIQVIILYTPCEFKNSWIKNFKARIISYRIEEKAEDTTALTMKYQRS